MRIPIVVVAVMSSLLLYAGQDVVSFCGFKLGDSISKSLGYSPCEDVYSLNGGHSRWKSYLKKPFRGFRFATLRFTGKDRLFSVRIEKEMTVTNTAYVASSSSEEDALTKGGHVPGNRLNARRPDVVYTREEVDHEFETLVKMVLKKFGEPVRKSYPECHSGAPGLMSRKGEFEYPTATLNIVYSSGSRSGLLGKWSETQFVDIHFSVSCESRKIADADKEEVLNEKRNLRKRVDSYTQEDLDAL